MVTAFLGWTLLFHMIPVLTLVGPWYIVFRELGWYDTLGALILTHVTLNLPITVWLMMAFFREIPPELNEAAQGRRLPATARVLVDRAAAGRRRD